MPLSKNEQDNQRLVWIDLEMTGLNPDKHVIIEIATLITDKELKILEEGPCLAINRSEEELNEMNEWNVTTHTNSGLLERVRKSDISIEVAEELTLEFIAAWLDKNMSPLAGNSIGQDRRFLRREMPMVDEYLHYRNVDVSTLKELAARWHPELKPYKKKGSHRALDDIKESIEELNYYRTHFIR
jgi:oligoribonuclease